MSIYGIRGDERFSDKTIARVKKLSDNIAQARPSYEIATVLGGTGIFLLLRCQLAATSDPARP